MIRLVLALSILALPATAQSNRNCAPRGAVLEKLKGEYNETQKSMGLAASGAVVEVWASELGTWTITVSSPHGVTCLVASGAAYQEGWDAPPLGEKS